MLFMQMFTFFITNINNISIFRSKMKTQTGVLWKKPLIGFEPMTYALPWRYSTAELKGLV